MLHVSSQHFCSFSSSNYGNYSSFSLETFRTLVARPRLSWRSAEESPLWAGQVDAEAFCEAMEKVGLPVKGQDRFFFFHFTWRRVRAWNLRSTWVKLKLQKSGMISFKQWANEIQWTHDKTMIFWCADSKRITARIRSWGLPGPVLGCQARCLCHIGPVGNRSVPMVAGSSWISRWASTCRPWSNVRVRRAEGGWALLKREN